MGTTRLTLLLLLSGSGAGSALAHPGHQHEAPAPEISEEQVKVRAKEEVGRLVERKKLDESWKATPLKALEKRTYKKTWEWVATFENARAVKDRVLYVFLKPSGQFVAANFTGK